MASHATESYEHNRCNFENSKRDWRVPDATDMPWHVKYEKKLHTWKDVYIKVSSSYCSNWDEENKNIESFLENTGTGRFESGWDWCYAREKIDIGFTWNMTVGLLKRRGSISIEIASTSPLSISSNLENDLCGNELYIYVYMYNK